MAAAAAGPTGHRPPEQYADDDIVVLDYDDRDEEEEWGMKQPQRKRVSPPRERPEWLGRPFTVESTVKQTKVWLHHGSHGKTKESWSL